MSKTNRGFTLVEVLVAGAMIVVLGLAMIAMLQTGMKGNKNNQEMNAAGEFIQVLSALLSDTATCNRNFGPAPGQNLVLSPATLTADLVDATGAVIYDVNSTTAYQNNLWTVDSYSVTSESVVSTAPQVEIARVDFKLGKKNPGSSVGVSTVIRSIRMWAQLTAVGGTIVSCHSLGAVGNEFWRTNNGNDIFKTNSGFVGIGTTTPSGLFSVGTESANGDFIVVPSGDVNVTGGSDNRWGIYHNLVEKMAFDNSGNIILNNANVGVGTTTPQVSLDVNGSIRAGSATIGAACTTEGAMAYDSAAHSPVYCSNTSVWKVLGGVAPTVSRYITNPSGFNGPYQALVPGGCHHYCAMAESHDCSGCGFTLENLGNATCADPTKYQFRTTTWKLHGEVMCFDNY